MRTGRREQGRETDNRVKYERRDTYPMVVLERAVVHLRKSPLRVMAEVVMAGHGCL